MTKSIAVLAAAAMLSVVGIVTTTPGASGAVRAAKAGTWAEGDCFKKADLGKDLIDLRSKVSCSKKHAVQVFAGIGLPDSFRDAGYAKLLNKSSAFRDAFVAFAEVACSRPNLVSKIYPTLGSALAPLFLTHDVTDFIPSAPGQMGWALPDKASFNAGAKDVLCAFGIDQLVFGSTSGDIRETETSAILPKFRLCRNLPAPDALYEFVSCSKPHEQEILIHLVMDVTGLPDDLGQWTEADFAPYDAACADFGEVLVGSRRTDFGIIGEPHSAPVSNSRRLIVCRTATTEGNQFPPGTVVGLGDTAIEVVPKPTE